MTLRTQQNLPAQPDAVWAFLRNPQNLHQVMPAEMKLKIDWPADKKLNVGDTFRTRLVKFGVPLTWDTKVVDMAESADGPRHFTDIQIGGPFKTWRHTHTVTPIEGGVRVEDELTLVPPLGALGRLGFPLIGRADMERLFAYRLRRMEALFGEWTPHTAAAARTAQGLG